MSTKLKCHQNWNIIKTKITSNLKCQKTEMSPKLKCHPYWNVTNLSSKITNLNSRDRHWIPWSCSCVSQESAAYVRFLFLCIFCLKQIHIMGSCLFIQKSILFLLCWMTVLVILDKIKSDLRFEKYHFLCKCPKLAELFEIRTCWLF